MSTYVIVRPGGWGHVSNDSEAHLVVNADEWLKVFLKEQDTYNYVTEHTSFDSAHNARNRLNGINDWVEEPAPEAAVEVEGAGVQWLGEKAA